MKKIIALCALVWVFTGQVSASFLYQETDPYCSLTGTTHTSIPGEISDTSSWNIPTAYEGECDEIPELSFSEKEKIYQVMHSFFESQWYYGSLYGNPDDLENGIKAFGREGTLNPLGQDFVNKKLFPVVSEFITQERAKNNPNLKNIAILNYAVKTIGYDYFVRQAQ